MSAVQHLVRAIAIRGEVDRGTLDKKQVVDRVKALARDGCFSDAQIAAIVRYSRGWVVGHTRAVRAASGLPSPAGGVLERDSLDLLLTLTGDLPEDQRANLLQAVIGMGTGTRLISRLTGVTLGTVLYQQRRMKGEADDA